MIQTLAKPGCDTTTVDSMNTHSQMHALRRRAITVLEDLLVAKAECERAMARANRTDAIENVTGTSSIDRTISSTRQTIAQLDAALASVDDIVGSE